MTKKDFNDFIKKAKNFEWDEDIYTYDLESDDSIYVFVIDSWYEYGFDESFRTYKNLKELFENFEKDFIKSYGKSLKEVKEIQFYTPDEDMVFLSTNKESIDVWQKD